MKQKTVEGARMGKTAGEAGWHRSRYNAMAKIPDSDKYAIVNMFKGTCSDYAVHELYLLDIIESLDDNHPIIERFKERGLIANFDERSALEAYGRIACGRTSTIYLTLCPSMGCNFDCPYCFENHNRGLMTQQIQEDVCAFAERLMKSARPKKLAVRWFGGEPLLGAAIIESLSGRLIALAEKYGAEYTAKIITNGYLLSQSVADMLCRCKVSTAQITLDGIGSKHDATRHLVGGGPTFERITQNLRTLKLPFQIHLRHNVHSDNYDQVEPMRKFTEELARESGNDIRYFPSPVRDNEVFSNRDQNVHTLCGNYYENIELDKTVRRFEAGRGIFCGACSLYTIGIDEQGNLHKCWENMDKPEYSFGTAAKWDPEQPIATAEQPDNLAPYLGTGLPIDDEECRECMWLPICAGGCPLRRLYAQKDCLSFKKDPERYVLAMYQRFKSNKS